MSPEPSAPSAPPPDGGGGDSRLHIRSITEMPAGHDAELATIFREMRRAADISVEQVAGRLATPVETIEALENGALLALPEWPELTRIITAYAAQLGLDSRPILRRLEGQLGDNKQAPATPVSAAPTPPAPKSATPPSPRPSGPPMPPSANSPAQHPNTAAPPTPRQSPLPQPPGATQPPPPAPSAAPQQQSPPRPQAQQDAGEAASEPEKKPKGRMARLMRSLLNWAVLIGFVAALGYGVWYAAKHPRMVWSTLDTLPEPVPRTMRRIWNFMRPLESKPARPQVSDPDNRKSDKLP